MNIFLKMKQDIQENETGFNLILYYHNKKQHSFKNNHKDSRANNNFRTSEFFSMHEEFWITLQTDLHSFLKSVYLAICDIFKNI